MKTHYVWMVYSSAGRVPVVMPERDVPYTEEEILAYAKEHIDELPLPLYPEYLEDSAFIDEEADVF